MSIAFLYTDIIVFIFIQGPFCSLVFLFEDYLPCEVVIHPKYSKPVLLNLN